MLRSIFNFHRSGILVLFAALAAGCGEGAAAPQAAGSRPPPPVSAATATAYDVPVYIDAIGKTISTEVVSVLPQIAGKVSASHVKDGAYIQKGDLLFEIDPAPFEATLAMNKAMVAQSRSELVWAESDFKRTEELMVTKVASQLEYDQKKSALGVVQAKIDAGEAAVKTAELNLAYTKIASPIEGRAGVRMVDPGNVVKANEGTMLLIQRLDPIYAEFTVTENDLGTVRKFMTSRGMELRDESTMGLKVEVDVPGDSKTLLQAMGSTAAGRAPTTAKAVGPRIGTLTFLDNAVQNNTGTVKLRATVPNADRYFWPGQFVNVRLILTTRKDAVLIPIVAQQIGQQGPYVYVVKADHTAEMRPIVPGQRQKDMLVIESGVSAGEQVIVGGHMMVAPGAKVTVMNAPAPATAPTAAAQ